MAKNQKYKPQPAMSPAVSVDAEAIGQAAAEAAAQEAEAQVVGTEPEVAAQVVDAEQPEDDGFSDVTVSASVSSDPMATIAAALVAIGKLYNDAGVISAALTNHMRTVVADPSLHSYLQRMQVSLGDLRHAIVHVEDSAPDHLREAIADAVS